MHSGMTRAPEQLMPLTIAAAMTAMPVRSHDSDGGGRSCCGWHAESFKATCASNAPTNRVGEDSDPESESDVHRGHTPG